MVAELSLISVNLATVCMESLLYGAFLVIFGTSTYLLVKREREMTSSSMAPGHYHKSIYKTPMFLGSILIALACTGHWILTVVRLFEAFVNFEGGTMPLFVYSDLALATQVAKTAFLVASVLIADAMIIYRLYVVWSFNKYIIILPMLTWCGLVVCGVGVVWQFAVYIPGDNVFLSSAGRWITSDCVFTFITNIYCSVMITYRLLRSNIRNHSYGGANVLGVLAIIVESAAIQTAGNLVFFISYEAKSNIQFTTCDLWCQDCGIAYVLINLRVALGWAQKGSQQQSSGLPTARVSQQRTDHSYAMRPLAVNITRVVNQEDDFGTSSLKKQLSKSDDMSPPV